MAASSRAQKHPSADIPFKPNRNYAASKKNYRFMAQKEANVKTY
jgi:hypothetical protein